MTAALLWAMRSPQDEFAGQVPGKIYAFAQAGINADSIKRFSSSSAAKAQFDRGYRFGQDWEARSAGWGEILWNESFTRGAVSSSQEMKGQHRRAGWRREQWSGMSAGIEPDSGRASRVRKTGP
jgi:hypothetical protein